MVVVYMGVRAREGGEEEYIGRIHCWGWCKESRVIQWEVLQGLAGALPRLTFERRAFCLSALRSLRGVCLTSAVTSHDGELGAGRLAWCNRRTTSTIKGPEAYRSQWHAFVATCTCYSSRLGSTAIV